MAVIRKSADDRWIAEVHAEFYAGIFGGFSIPERNVDHVAQKWLVDDDTEPFGEHEVDLVNMEGVKFLGTILDIPILDVSRTHDDIRRRRIWIKGNGLLAFDRDEESGRAVGIVGILQFFSEIEAAFPRGRNRAEPR